MTAVSTLDTVTVPADLLSRALGEVADGCVIVDAEQRVVYVNEAFSAISGYPADEVLGRPFHFLRGPHTDRATLRSLRQAIVEGTAFEGTLLHHRRDGTPFWNNIVVRPLPGSAGQAVHRVVIHRDVSLQRSAQQESLQLLTETRHQRETARLLLAAARRLSEKTTTADVAQAVAHMIRLMCGSDRSAVALWHEEEQELRFHAASGWGSEDTPRLLAFTATRDDSPELIDLMSNSAPILATPDRSSPWLAEVLEAFHLSALAAAPISGTGAFRGLVIAHWSLTTPPTGMEDALQDRLTGLASLAAVGLENARLVERVQWSASHDALTGLPTRSLMTERLQQTLGETARTSPTAVVYCDVDRFKRTNDSLGHFAGDELLRHIADRLRSAVREGDTVARLGGDEFVLVLPAVRGRGDVAAVLERVRAALAEPVELGGRRVYVSLSAGVALSSETDRGLTPPEQVDQLLQRADAEMYRAKVRNRGRTAPGRVVDELRLDSELHGAVARGELSCVFQPQIDLCSDRVLALEALVRWWHPELGSVPPDAFIPVAEENGVIHEIGAFVLEQACRVASEWWQRGRELDVAVNVSASQLASADFLPSVRRVLADTALPARALIVEITESQVIVDLGTVTKRLDALRRLGVQVSVDDFGTGYSSLTQLQSLPATELKIDQSFVRAEGERAEALVAAVVGLAHGLGLRVVGEGAETPRQLTMLRLVGCDRAQGYAIARPVPAEELAPLLGEAPFPR